MVKSSDDRLEPKFTAL